MFAHIAGLKANLRLKLIDQDDKVLRPKERHSAANTLGLHTKI